MNHENPTPLRSWLVAGSLRESSVTSRDRQEAGLNHENPTPLRSWLVAGSLRESSGLAHGQAKRWYERPKQKLKHVPFQSSHHVGWSASDTATSLHEKKQPRRKPGLLEVQVVGSITHAMRRRRIIRPPRASRPSVAVAGSGTAGGATNTLPVKTVPPKRPLPVLLRPLPSHVYWMTS